MFGEKIIDCPSGRQDQFVELTEGGQRSASYDNTMKGKKINDHTNRNENRISRRQEEFQEKIGTYLEEK